MKYMTTVQAAEQWNISSRRVTNLLKKDRVPNAVQIGGRWMIPETAQKPADGRTKYSKLKKTNTACFFRYPSFEGQSPNHFNPSLTSVEIKIKEMSEAFHACQFKSAEKKLTELTDEPLSKYERLYILFGSCMIYWNVNKPVDFFSCYEKLLSELENDFPMKNEFSSLPHEISSALGLNSFFISGFHLDSDYTYHDSFRPHLASLCILTLFFSKPALIKENDLIPYELICSEYESKECFLDLQSMHLYLGIIYGFMGQEIKMKVHIQKGLALAENKHLMYQPALLYYYYAKFFDSTLGGFPSDFVKRLRHYSLVIHANYSDFMRNISCNTIYNLLLSKDYPFVFCAARGYSNHEVAQLLHMSNSSVGNKYSEIYQNLGIKNKSELIEYYHRSMNGHLIQSFNHTQSDN